MKDGKSHTDSCLRAEVVEDQGDATEVAEQCVVRFALDSKVAANVVLRKVKKY